jgi:hypothetical protein
MCWVSSGQGVGSGIVGNRRDELLILAMNSEFQEFRTGSMCVRTRTFCAADLLF